MSFDIFLQGFRPTPNEGAAAVRLTVPYLESPVDGGFARLVFADGATEIYGIGRSDLMFTHTSGRLALDLIVDIARAERWAILMPGCPTCVVDSTLIPELPEDLRPNTAVLTNGTDLLSLLESN